MSQVGVGLLAVVIPSRGRPEQCAKLVCRIDETTSTLVRCVVVVDTDDPLCGDYKDMLVAAAPSITKLVITSTTGHVAATNAGAAHALTWERQPAAVAKLDDDHWPVTHGWDVAMLRALANMGGGIVYGDDLFQSARLPTAPAISVNVIEALGWMGPPVLQHMFVDNFWRDLGRKVGRLRYLPDVVIEHRHHAAEKALVDAGYERTGTEDLFETDRVAYQAFLANRHDGMRAAVRAVRWNMGWRRKAREIWPRFLGWV